MGDMPFMTPNGTFVINGTERVIVSQMHRSPGVFFDHDQRQDARLGQAAVRRPHHSLSRLLARLRVRRQGHRLCAHRPAPQAAGDDAALCAGLDDEEILSTFYKSIIVKETKRGWKVPFVAREDARHDAGRRPGRRQVGRSRGQGRREDHGQARARAGRGRPQGGAVQRRRPRRPVPGRGHRQPADRRDLRRSRRRARRQAARGAEGSQGQGIPDPRHRPRHGRRLHPQHAERRQERQPRGSADGHLPGHAPGRAADAGCRRGRCSTACSSIPSATTSRRSAA